MNRDSNSYTFLFAAIMVFVVASSLAFTATSLKRSKTKMFVKNKCKISCPLLESKPIGMGRKIVQRICNQQLALTLEGEVR